MKKGSNGSQRKIGIFLFNLDAGGAERQAVNLANAMAEEGHKIQLILLEARGPYLKLVSPKVEVVDLGCVRARHALFPLVRHLRKERLKGLFSFFAAPSVIAIVARLLSFRRLRLVISERNTASQHPELPPLLQWFVFRFLYRLADGIVTVSHGAAKDLEQVGGFPPGYVEGVYNPVVTETLRRQRVETPRHPWLAPGQPPVVLAMGRLTAQKDFDLLLRAFALLRKTHDARLVIYGEGEERAALEKRCAEQGLKDVVDLPGLTDNPYAPMAACALFVLSSRYEGLPGVLIEALACGAPVIATDCPSGPREILAAGKYGMLVPVGDEKALAEAMAAVLKDPQPHRTKTRLFQQEAMQAFLPQKSAQDYLRVLFEGPRRRQRIAFLVHQLGNGGAERVAVNLANTLFLQGYDIEFVLQKKTGIYLNEVIPGIGITALYSRSGRSMVFSIAAYFRRNRPDAILSFMTYMNRFAILAALLTGRRSPLVVSEHSTLSRGEERIARRKKRLVRMFYGFADEIVAVSRGAAEDLEIFCGMKPGRVTYIPNPVITPSLFEKMTHPPAHPWFNGVTPMIVSVGRLVPVKNQALLLKAFALLRKEHDMRLVIYGEGEERSQLMSLANELGVQDAFDLPGNTDNPYPYMKHASLVALTSDVEGLPTVLIEALACGTPVVSTDCPSGPREILADGKYGELVPMGDEAALAEAMRKVLDDPETYRAKTQAFQKEAMEKFTADYAAGQYLKILFPEKP